MRSMHSMESLALGEPVPLSACPGDDPGGRSRTPPSPVPVPTIDATGNQVAGILTPGISAPLATYAGWNLRDRGHAIGKSCSPPPDADHDPRRLP